MTSEADFNCHRIKGNWMQVSGKVKAAWGHRTDGDGTQING